MFGYIVLTMLIYWWILRSIERYEKQQPIFNWPREICMQLFFIYLLCLYFIVFAPFAFKIPDFSTASWNLTPFVEIIYQFKRKVNGIPIYGLLYLVGNILLFIPLGLFLPIFHSQFASLIKMILFGMFISFLIEWIQATFTSRAFDIDDVIFNTLGAMFGYFIFLTVRRIRLLHRIGL